MANLNVYIKAIKLLKEDIRKNFHDLQVDNYFLNQKEKYINFGSIKIIPILDFSPNI